MTSLTSLTDYLASLFAEYDKTALSAFIVDIENGLHYLRE